MSLGTKCMKTTFFCFELIYELRSQVALESCRAELEEQTGLVLEVELNFAQLITCLCHFKWLTYQPAVLSSSFTMLCDYLSEIFLQASQALERLEEGRGDEATREEEVRRPTFFQPTFFVDQNFLIKKVQNITMLQGKRDRRGKTARSPGPTFSRKINFFSEKVWNLWLIFDNNNILTVRRMIWATTTWAAMASTTLATSTLATLVCCLRKAGSRWSPSSSSSSSYSHSHPHSHPHPFHHHRS